MSDGYGPRPPNDVNERAKKLWKSVVNEYPLGDWQLELLRRACEMMTQVDEARESLKQWGDVTYIDKAGQPKPRPEIGIINSGIKLIKELLNTLYLDPPDEDKDLF